MNKAKLKMINSNSLYDPEPQNVIPKNQTHMRLNRGMCNSRYNRENVCVNGAILELSQWFESTKALFKYNTAHY